MENDEIDLRQLFKLLWEKRTIIIAIVLVSVIIGYIYSNFMIKPVYTSSTTLILAQKNSTSTDVSGTITQTDVTLNDKLIDTYKEIATSNSVIRTVASNLNLTNIDEESLKKEINVTAITGTQILKISVTDSDPNRATQIANEMGKVFANRISEIYKIENISTVDEAEVPDEPSNINHKKDILIFLAIGIVVAIGFVLIANMLDNTIKSSSDITNALKVTILAEIPECDFGRKNGRK